MPGKANWFSVADFIELLSDSGKADQVSALSPQPTVEAEVVD
jgi:hypothetical protein